MVPTLPTLSGVWKSADRIIREIGFSIVMPNIGHEKKHIALILPVCHIVCPSTNIPRSNQRLVECDARGTVEVDAWNEWGGKKTRGCAALQTRRRQTMVSESEAL